MSYLTQRIRNAYDNRSRDELERSLVKVEALERAQQGAPPPQGTPEKPGQPATPSLGAARP